MAVDISPYATHAILAGKEILKTVQVSDWKITEELNLRSTVISYASHHDSQNGASVASKRRDFLPAADFKWPHAEFDSIIATAGNNGRISIYDIISFSVRRREEERWKWKCRSGAAERRGGKDEGVAEGGGEVTGSDSEREGGGSLNESGERRRFGRFGGGAGGAGGRKTVRLMTPGGGGRGDAGDEADDVVGSKMVISTSH